VSVVRAALSPTLFANSFAEGKQLSLEEAYATVLAGPALADQAAADRPVALLGSGAVATA
jgi:hypothetical protein